MKFYCNVILATVLVFLLLFSCLAYGQDNTVQQAQAAFKSNEKLENKLSEMNSPDNEAVIYAKKSKKPKMNKSDVSEILARKSENIDPTLFSDSEEKIEWYDSADMAETITHFAAIKSMSEPMKDGLGGIAQNTNPSVMQGKCQRCTIKLGSAFQDCCNLRGIAEGLFGGCRQEEKELAHADLKDKRCNLIQQKYCTQKKWGACVEKKSAYCCYGSQMGKIVQEIAHQQLNISWGDGDNPNCASLTADQLSQLNFSTPFARGKLAEMLTEYQTAGTKHATQIQYKITELQNTLSQKYQKPVIRSGK